MKVTFSKNNVSKDINKSLSNFSDKTVKALKKKAQINTSDFSEELTVLGMHFEKQNQKPVMNKVGKKLAETIVSLGDNNLAGIVYSFLIKFNEGNSKLVEELAINALAIAKRQHDPVHIMARANDLKEIYKIVSPSSEKFLDVLYTEKRALKDIVSNYSNVQKRHNTISKKMKPREVYEVKFASVKYDIGNFLQEKDPSLARQELTESMAIYEKYGVGPVYEKAKVLLEKLGK